MKTWLAVMFALLSACADPQAATWVEAIESAHAAADDALARRDLASAITTLDRALALPPEGIARADVRAVRADLLYRIASLELDRQAPAAARARADEGLALGTPDDLYTANLYLARGRANEALGQAGAIDDYHRALLINEALLATLLED